MAEVCAVATWVPQVGNVGDVGNPGDRNVVEPEARRERLPRADIEDGGTRVSLSGQVEGHNGWFVSQGVDIVCPLFSLVVIL